MKPTITVLACLLLVLTACSGEDVSAPSSTTTSAPAGPDIDLTEEWGCGFGFYASNQAQTSGMILSYNDFAAAEAGGVPAVATLPDPAWDVRFDVGEDLFANWCDDVIEPDEPERIVLEEWDVIAGTIEVTSVPDQFGGPATASLRGFVILGPQGQTVELPDREITNRGWGFFAG